MKATSTRTRAEINRANAQHSTGPKSVVGKGNSSHNSFKHGLYSKQLVTSVEEAAELDALRADLRAEHQPINQTEEILVNEMAEQFWRIRRARRMEALLFESGKIVLTHLAAIQRMMSSAERGFHKSLATLRQLQKDEPAGLSGAKTQARQRERQRATTKLSAESCELTASSGFVPQSAVAQENAVAQALSPAEEAAPELIANSCELTASPGFVPPTCPRDIDPTDWAEAFQLREKIWKQSRKL